MGKRTKQPKLAVIYVRVSSEHQAEKCSPEEQEIECRKIAEEKGLTVVEVFRDTQKYRAGRRLVEPSGTRTDRPGMLKILEMAANDEFDTLIAWREDRLYRGLKAMILVLDVINENGLNVFFVKENFDHTMAPIKAWVGEMELKGMRERMTMGVKARLKSGRANTGQDRYGYRRDGDVIVICEEEAIWVRKIYEWYIDNVPMMEIRRRLIEGNAPQKEKTSIPRKIRWAKTSIHAILHTPDVYASGVKVFTREGERFELPIPPIIDQETCERAKAVRKENRTYPARNIKYDYLCSGLVTCPCNRRWQVSTLNHATRKNRRGEIVPRKTPQRGNYYCTVQYKEMRHPDCPRSIGKVKLDEYVWNRVCSVVSDPEILLSTVRRSINKMKEEEEDREKKLEQIQRELDVITSERQWVITQARKGNISIEDMEYQLDSLGFQELEFKRQMTKQNEASKIAALTNWEDIAKEYIQSVSSALEWLNAAPQNGEERHLIFEQKKMIVKRLIERIIIQKDREITVVFQLDLIEIINQATAVQSQSAGTCSHIQSYRVHRHPSGCGG